MIWSRIKTGLGGLALTGLLWAQPAIPPEPRPAPPTPPIRKAPTEIFRELLSASPAEREKFLSARSPAARQSIETKLREFEALSAEHRELRLQVAELQHFLFQLIQAPPHQQAEVLAKCPKGVRPLLEERWQTWVQLAPDRQRELLESQKSLSWFVRGQANDPQAVTNLLAQIPAGQRTEIEAQLVRWRALTPEERARKTADFQRFFELSERERVKVLRTVSSEERQEMEATLAQFASLPPEQRERAVHGFRRFLALTAPERAEFLQGIAQWQQMTPTERATWRQMVALITAPPPMPPKPRARSVLVSTNSP
jgi:hypothetical protein